MPIGVAVLERGWLSSNNVVLSGAPGEPTTLVDSGYCTHGPQTVALVRRHLAGRRLHTVINTHLHSDHCGGNALLQSAFGARVAIPPGEAEAATQWDMSRLSYEATGQRCERFKVDKVVAPGDVFDIAGRYWQVLAAPGHDPHSIMLFSPEEQLLISADALWQNGFGVVFPEIEGETAFREVRATLDLIAALDSTVVIPGHGSPFRDVEAALERAYRRLESFEASPDKHGWYAGKALAKFHLLEVQQEPLDEMLRWLADTPYFQLIHTRYFRGINYASWSQRIIEELQKSRAVTVSNGVVFNT
nr:MBL fold metallo-hydrolase [Caldimonas mangrovi]